MLLFPVPNFTTNEDGIGENYIHYLHVANNSYFIHPSFDYIY